MDILTATAASVRVLQKVDQEEWLNGSQEDVCTEDVGLRFLGAWNARRLRGFGSDAFFS